MSDNLTTQDTIIAAWNMAITSTTITEKLIFHSDRGSQYASYVFTDVIKKDDGLVKQSMSRKDLRLRIKTSFLNVKNNAVAESFFKSLKVEWVYKHKYLYRSQAELSIFSCISK